MQRLRQLEPSWLRSGQTTSLLESLMEKDDVRDDRGGIVSYWFNPTMYGGFNLKRGVRWAAGCGIDLDDKMAI